MPAKKMTYSNVAMDLQNSRLSNAETQALSRTLFPCPEDQAGHLVMKHVRRNTVPLNENRHHTDPSMSSNAIGRTVVGNSITWNFLDRNDEPGIPNFIVPFGKGDGRRIQREDGSSYWIPGRNFAPEQASLNAILNGDFVPVAGYSYLCTICDQRDGAEVGKMRVYVAAPERVFKAIEAAAAGEDELVTE